MGIGGYMLTKLLVAFAIGIVGFAVFYAIEKFDKWWEERK